MALCNLSSNVSTLVDERQSHALLSLIFTARSNFVATRPLRGFCECLHSVWLALQPIFSLSCSFKAFS